MVGAGTRALVVGISGASSSGKTTLSRLLRCIFLNTFILHEDDFFKEENNLAFKHGFKDGDCAKALKIPEIATALAYIKKHGSLPPDLKSTGDRNIVPELESLVPDSTIAALKEKVKSWILETEAGKYFSGSSSKDSTCPPALKLCILDGFLLYSESMTAIHEYMDIKYFLPVTYEQSKGRRESRPPYALKDGGVWQDPPRYFDKIVWPNYVEEHRWMFENGDVNGRVKSDTMREKGIRAHIDRGLDLDMETTLKWAVESLITDLTDLLTE